MKVMNGRLGDIGERKAVDIIRGLYGYGWPYEDSFFFPSGNRYVLVTTDSITGSRHVPQGASPERVGYFLAAVNLSDIAAMAGRPLYLLTSLILPRGTTIDYLKGLERGIGRCLDRYGARMAGGDLKEGPLALTGIAIGEVEKGRMLRRDSMHCGDLLCVTGRLGRNAAAYYMWKGTGQGRWAEAVLRIEPRIPEARLLARLGATSATDLSDGVYSSIAQLGGSSGRGFEIKYDSLPVDRLALKVGRSLGIGIEELALNFGGEYELLFTIPRDRYGEARKRLDITCIGRVTKGSNILIKDGRRTRINDAGYEHFRMRRVAKGRM